MTYAQDLEEARHFDREHPDPEMSCSYEEAVVTARIEMETCRCPRDEEGQPHPDNVNDLCEWHGGIMDRALESGKFWTEDWPYGEFARPAPARPGMGR